jgi:hypothetical protein
MSLIGRTFGQDGHVRPTDGRRTNNHETNATKELHVAKLYAAIVIAMLVASHMYGEKACREFIPRFFFHVCYEAT